MNSALIQNCLLLSKAAAQIAALSVANIARATIAASSSGERASWPAVVVGALDSASENMKASTSAFDVVWQTQRSVLGLEAASQALRALQDLHADTLASSDDLRAKFLSDSAGQLSDWLLAMSKARDANDLVLATFLYFQQSQDTLKSAASGGAGIATRLSGAVPETLRRSLQDPLPAS